MYTGILPSVQPRSLKNSALEPAPTRLLFAAVLAAALAVTRWPIAPRFLFDFDNVNFALALKQFAPLLSQPHRGYPLYVGVSHIVHWFGFSPEWTSLFMGFLGSLAALVFLIPLARDMFGFRAAWIAPLLLFCHPTFVMAGAVDHVRTFLAAGAIATALFVWRGQFKTAAFVLGIAGGFRMELPLTLLPLLLLSPLLVHRVSWKRLLAPCAILALTIAPWLLFTILRSGGFSSALHYNSAMLRGNARSFLYEGFTHRAMIMALFATYWNGIGSLSWLWAIPAAISRDNAPGRWRQFAFLALWFVPSYLFSAAVQVTDPDQTLASVAATCVAGAWALSQIRPRWTALACLISVAIFVFPPVHMGKEASLPWIRRVSAAEQRALEGVARAPGPRLISIRGEYPTWRLVSYYFPDDWIQQSNVTAHANRETADAPPRDLRSHLVINQQGDVSIE